jgi:RNA 2',3'-cyclic 3'-phosphodiesterase
VPADDVPRWRVFLAVEISAEVRGALHGPIEGLQALGTAIRINQVERIHLTLHFLGHLPAAEVERLSARIAPATRARRRFAVDAHGVGAFPSWKRANVVWAGIAGGEVPQLTALQAELGAELAAAGIPLEDRFHPHLTLARVRAPLVGQKRRLLDVWAAAWREVELGQVPVDAVQLMRSELGAGPPRYSTLASFPLK